jgi:hypothetical protein
MKYKKIVIESDGTSAGTILTIDGNVISAVQRIDFSSDVNSVYCVMNIQVAKQRNGKIDIKKVRVRDAKTEKFNTQDLINSVPLSLERDA